MQTYKITEENIPPDLEPDKDILLYRYMSYSSLCEILINDYIQMIPVGKFSDKLEGKAIEKILLKLYPKNLRAIELAMPDYYRTIYISSWYKIKNQIDNKKVENAAMWDRYTRDNESVLVETNANLLLDCIRNGSYKGPIIIKPVKYIGAEYSDVDIENIGEWFQYERICFYYKFIDFVDESEVRILCATKFNQGGLASLRDEYLLNMQKGEQRAIEISGFSPYLDMLPLGISSANTLIQKIIISPKAHNNFIKIVKQQIEIINIWREENNKDRIECKIVESGQKRWL